MEIGGYQGLRVRVGNTCGSGAIVRIDRGLQRMWVLTNAHVVGTQIGRAVTLGHIDDDGLEIITTGRIIAAGYRSQLAVDWAIVEAPLAEWANIARPIAPASAEHRKLTTVGCPRCELPSFRRLRLVSSAGPVARATPTAVGGQSGSGIFSDGFVVGLITWTNGRETLYQPAAALRRTMDPQWFASSETGWELPADAVPACEEMQPTDDGFHGMVPVGFFDASPHEVADFAEWLELLRLLAPIVIEWIRRRNMA